MCQVSSMQLHKMLLFSYSQKKTEIQGGHNYECIKTTDLFRKCKRNFTEKICFSNEYCKTGDMEIRNDKIS